MPANTNPIFALRGGIAWSANVTAANTTLDGASGTVSYLNVGGGPAFVAGTDGTFVPGVQFTPKGANVASLARLFINNGGVETTGANNCLIRELLLPATALSQTAPQPPVFAPLGFILPSGYKVFWTLATAVATGWQASMVVGEYS